jgi:hypothetical protein
MYLTGWTTRTPQCRHTADVGAIDTLIGSSPPMRAVRDQIERLLPPEADKRTPHRKELVRPVRTGPRMGPCTHEPDVRSGCPGGQGGGQAADGPAHMDPCPSSTRELPPARPNAVHEDDVALVAEPPNRPPHGGLGRGDRGGKLGDGEGPGGEGGGHAPGDARAGEEVGRLRELGVGDRHRAAGREAEPERERGRPAPAVVLPVIGGDEELVASRLLARRSSQAERARLRTNTDP